MKIKKGEVQTFRAITKTQKQLFLTIVSALGLKANIHSIGLVDNHFDAEILFEE
ncbi:MAG: hypothetical protein AAF599_03965 [Bacteroidota bacterium]